MSLLNIPTKPRRSFPLASLSVLAKVAKARVAADLLPISEKEVRDLSFPSPAAAPRRLTTLLPLLLYLPSPTVLPCFLSLPRQQFFLGVVTVFESGDPVLRFRVCIVLPESYKSATGLDAQKNPRARMPRRYRNVIATLLLSLLPLMQKIPERSRRDRTLRPHFIT